MTALQPPSFMQAGSHPASSDRLVLQSLVATAGTVGLASLAVSQRGAGANMSVDVAAGSAFIDGTESGTQGFYHVHNDATVNVALAASDPTNSRIDLIVARVRDAEYSGGVSTWSIEAVTGTPAGSPAAPATPDNALVLAEVLIPASDAAVTDSQLSDLAPAAVGLGGKAATIVYAAPGSYTFDPDAYPWLRAVHARKVIGAGGGGGGGMSPSTPIAFGGGGGGGANAEKFVGPSDLRAVAGTIPVTVGARGAAGAIGANGGTGGKSQFGGGADAWRASAWGGGGGRGGFADGFSATNGDGGVAGTTSVGDVGSVGSPGSDGNAGSTQSSGGSSLVAGRGPKIPSSDATGATAAANAYGQGGQGGSSERAGGQGGPGLVVLDLYA